MSLPSLKCCLTVLDKKAWSIDLHRDVSSSLGLSGMLDLDPYSNQNSNEDESLTIPGNIIYSSMTAYAKLGNFSYNNKFKQFYSTTFRVIFISFFHLLMLIMNEIFD